MLKAVKLLALAAAGIALGILVARRETVGHGYVVTITPDERKVSFDSQTSDAWAPYTLTSGGVCGLGLTQCQETGECPVRLDGITVEMGLN